MIDMNALKLEFCKWVETNPIVTQTEPPADLDQFVYFKRADGTHYKIEIAKIPIKFKPLVGK